MIRLLPLLAPLALSGCAALAALDRASAPQDVHELRAPAEVPTGRATGLELTVEPFATGGAIDTESILVRPGPTQVAYLPEARWSAPAPEMLRTATVETALRTGAFAHVGRAPLAATGDLALVATLLDFGAVVAPGGEAATVEVTLVARLVRERDAAVIASRTFRQAVPVPDTSAEAILDGYSTASDAVLGELAGWLLDRAR
ncbi:ABC-type transport auxiliary lipoprotein family protein [Rhodovulum sp. 12E13]|uniref:ABC-type transport auxiliary lipoprotein family protein n=1 Tax=Rhodovulum sp. 12E13 TaxID=2203891 RepID=UPI0013142473|nr:ABC-type transport auxiliary lipoprotein family protein [Rhodovulum sp. 12E13]